MKKTIIAMLFIAVSSLATAQNLQEGSHSITPSPDSAYLYAEWLPATITLKDNSTIKAKARYNASRNEMEVIQDGTTFVISPKIVEKINITNVLFVPQGKANSAAFYQLVDETPKMTFLQSFNTVNGKLVSKLFKKINKTGKIVPFKKEGIKKNPFLFNEKELVKTESVKSSTKTDITETTINGAYQGKQGVTKKPREDAISTGITTFDNREKKINGSPYLNPKYEKGSVYLKNENKKIVSFLKFNVQKNEFELLFNDKIIILDPLQIKKVVVGNKIFIPYTDLRLNVNFYEYLGKIDDKEVLKLYTTRLKDEAYVPGKSVGNPSQKITIISNYFVSNDITGSIKPIKHNKKALLALFGKKKKQIEQYVKQNRINIKDDASLVKLIKYASTL